MYLWISQVMVNIDNKSKWSLISVSLLIEISSMVLSIVL